MTMTTSHYGHVMPFKLNCLLLNDQCKTEYNDKYSSHLLTVRLYHLSIHHVKPQVHCFVFCLASVDSGSDGGMAYLNWGGFKTLASRSAHPALASPSHGRFYLAGFAVFYLSTLYSIYVHSTNNCICTGVYRLPYPTDSISLFLHCFIFVLFSVSVFLNRGHYMIVWGSSGMFLENKYIPLFFVCAFVNC